MAKKSGRSAEGPRVTAAGNKDDLPVREQLECLIAGLSLIRREQPGLTLVGLETVMRIALATLEDNPVTEFRTVGGLARDLGLSQQAVTNLMSTLGAQGRVRDGKATGGQGLVETDDWIKSRRVGAYVLSKRGSGFVQRFLAAATGRHVDPLRLHDISSLFQRLFAKGE